MFRLFYISSATRFASGGELNEILSASRARNRAAGITSLLLYYDGSFAQLLEGPKDAVLAAYKRIEQDARHCGFAVIFQEDAKERFFEGWDLAFLPTSKITTAERYDFISLQSFHASPQYAAAMKHMVLKSFMKSFKAAAPEAADQQPKAVSGAKIRKRSAPYARSCAILRGPASRFSAAAAAIAAANDNVEAPPAPQSARRRRRIGFRLFSIGLRAR